MSKESKKTMRATTVKYRPGEAYLKIKPLLDEETFDHLYPACVMCSNVATVVAPETNEALCIKCVANNDCARAKNL